jgi:putative ABC transport system permease protein
MHIGPMVRAMKHNRTRVVLIVLEIAMTLAIVTNCVNVILAERHKMAQKSGFDDDNIVWMKIRPFTPEFKDPAYLGKIMEQDIRTIESIPGVRAAANTNMRLWEGGGSSSGVFVPGEDREPVTTQIYYASKDLVPTLGGTMSEGRAFADEDYPEKEGDTTNHVMITKSVADLLFPDGHAVGKTIQQGRPGKTFREPMVVVGVLRDFYNPFGRATDPTAFSDKCIIVPSFVGGYRDGMNYQIRTEPGAMKSVIAEVEKRLTANNAGRVLEFKTTQEKKDAWFADSHIVVTTMTCIIVTLVAITALGLLGLTSLSVAERTKQIGTRRALGATRTDILRHFLIENWLITTAGLALGVFGAYALNFLLVSHVSDVKMQWQLIAAGMLLLWINGLISTVPPAMRAMRVPPSVATRSI